jgi:phosphatidylinositol glycan class A protein
MVSDFFFPNAGGVETAIYQISQCLLRKGHKVVVITHAFGRRQGIRWMANGLKVYYLPVLPFYQSATLPTLFFSLPLFRQILVRERINLVHCHQAFSCMGHEALIHCSMLGLPSCFTDHSLFGFRDASSIHMNKVLKLVLADVSHIICVSNTSKENTVLRAALDPRMVSVIPNAIDAAQFIPAPLPALATATAERLVVIVVSRLTYRKGIDLLLGVLPLVCRTYPFVDFIIGGDGPKRQALEEVIERHQLHDRVELLGALVHSAVPAVLNRGHIFLNCSLTEAFCIAIVEAASCGLLVVSTNVGGVPEVLPADMIELADPNVTDLVRALVRSFPRARLLTETRRWTFHERVRRMYNWDNVASRHEVIYHRVLAPAPAPFIDRLHRYYACGIWAGKIWCCVVVSFYLFGLLLAYLQPLDSIEIAPDWPTPTARSSTATMTTTISAASASCSNRTSPRGDGSLDEHTER